MLLTVQHRLIQVRNTPTLRNVERKQCSKLFSRFPCDRVAPGTEFRQLSSLGIKWQIAVHHGGHADCADFRQLDTIVVFHIGAKPGKAGLQSGVNRFHGVGPDTVHQLVFPLEVAGRDRDMALVDEHRLDAGRAELDAERGFR